MERKSLYDIELEQKKERIKQKEKKKSYYFDCNKPKFELFNNKVKYDRESIPLK